MTVKDMIATHPGSTTLDGELLNRAISTLDECATICTQCADACLGEPDLSPALADCIRTDLDCADVCAATSRVLARQTAFDAEVARALVQACVTACGACADDCESHAEHMDHCRVCAEMCRRCEQVCQEVVAALA